MRYPVGLRSTIVALTSAGLLATLAPAVADAGVRTFKLRTGPYRMSDFNVRFPKHRVRAPKVTGYLTDMNARLVDRRGRPVTIRNVMLHHLVFKNSSRFVGRKKACRAPNGEAFFGTGEEHQRLDLPEGYGYPLKRSDRWRMNVMLMSHSAAPRKVYVEYTGRIVTGRRLKRVVPYWVAANGCSSNPSFPVYGGGPPGSVAQRSYGWKVPINGELVAAGGHLHGGSKDLFVTQRRCGDRKLFDNAPLYGTPDDIVYTSRPILHEPGPVNTRWFSSRRGIPLQRGERLNVTGVYDNQYPHTRVMAITHMYIHPTKRRTTRGCPPLPADAQQTRLVHAGRAAPPHFPVPLNGYDEQGDAVEIDKPPGPFRTLRSGATVDIRDFRFRPANIRLSVGSTLKWRFSDKAEHNVTWADGPGLVGSRTLADGAVDATRFSRPGTYKLFCYLHPLAMTQVVQVTGAAPVGPPADDGADDSDVAATVR